MAMRSARPGKPAPLPTSTMRSRPVHRRAASAVNESRKCLIAMSAGAVIAVRFTDVFRSMSSFANRSHDASCAAESVTERREASRASASNGALVAGTLGIVRAARSRAFARLAIICATAGAMLMLGSATLAAPAAVTIQNSSFVAPAVTVNVGETVTWTNRDFSQHTATAAGVFDTSVLSQNQSRTIVMTRAGTFQYICSIHTFMTGTVSVVGAATPTPAPPTPPPPTSAPPTPAPPTPAPPTPRPSTPTPAPIRTATPLPAATAPAATAVTATPAAAPTASPEAVAQSSPSPRTDPPASIAPSAAGSDPGPALAVAAGVAALTVVGLGAYVMARRR